MLEIGSLVAGKFRVLEVLGKGGMGTVYDVLHEQIDKRRALKVLHAHEVMTADGLRRFHLEMKTDAAIQSPHVVEVFDAGELDGGIPYIVMERLEGETLADLLEREGTLPIAEICDLVAQACAGVHAANEAGIVHRDLKPANLFITQHEGKPFVKILDFGIAKFARGLRDDVTMTQEGAMLGTPLYMAPEQIRASRDVDARADVYALGVILYECATGETPYWADSSALLGVLICEGDPIPVSDLRPDSPDVFQHIVAQAMAVDRNDRYANAEALGSALQAMLAGGGSSLLETRDIPGGTSEEKPYPKTRRVFRQATKQAAHNPATAPGRTKRMGLAVGGTMIALAVGGWAWSLAKGTSDEEGLTEVTVVHEAEWSRGRVMVEETMAVTRGRESPKQTPKSEQYKAKVESKANGNSRRQRHPDDDFIHDSGRLSGEQSRPIRL